MKKNIISYLFGNPLYSIRKEELEIKKMELETIDATHQTLRLHAKRPTKLHIKRHVGEIRIRE